MNIRHNYRLLKAIGDLISRKYCLPRAAPDQLWINCCSACPEPILLRSPGARLWLDKYYAAIQLNGGEVRYLYLTLTHILEEKMNYRLLSLKRPNAPALPPEIDAQFEAARRAMLANGSTLWLHPLLKKALPAGVVLAAQMAGLRAPDQPRLFLSDGSQP